MRENLEAQTETFQGYLNRQLSESLHLVYFACALATTIFLLGSVAILGARELPVEIAGLKLGLTAYFTAAAAWYHFRHPSPSRAHPHLAFSVLLTLASTAITPQYGLPGTFTDLVVIVIVASGVFALEYRWLSLLNLSGLACWYSTHSAYSIAPRAMEFSTLVFAVMSSFLLCYIRRDTYYREHSIQHRKQLIREKLASLKQHSLQHKFELKESLQSMVEEKARLERSLEEKAVIVEDLKKHVELSRHTDSLGRMAGGVAHDFNNLLTVLFFNLDELRDGCREEAALHDLHEARAAADRVAELTSQLLALSRRQILQLKAIDPGLHIQKLHPTMSKLLGEDTQVKLQVEFPSTLELVVDPDLLDQALLTLIGLSRSDHRRGGTVTITLEADENDLRYVIRHSGWKTPPPDISELELREDDVTAITELSLAAVEGVVEQHQGRFEAVTEEDSATYHISLPLTRDEIPDEAPEERPGRHKKSGAVLILEEDTQVRRLLARFLRRKSFDVRTFQSWDELESQQEVLNHAAVLICDYVTSSSGRAAVRDRLKLRWPTLKTIYMSGPEYGTRKAGQTDPPSCIYLPKPFSLKNLGESVGAFVTA